MSEAPFSHPDVPVRHSYPLAIQEAGRAQYGRVEVFIKP
jgi:hypothetical protein